MSSSTRSALRLAGAAAAVLLVAAHASVGRAQTPYSSLSEPNGPPALAKSRPVAKEKSAESPKTCSRYGAGYVNVPGTNTCVKLGTAVRTDAVVNVGR